MTDRIPILLMACPIAGFQYHAGEAYWPELKPGDELLLCREHGNHYDARAIRVEWRGVPLGYVPREANFTVAQMLDRGERIKARIAMLRESSDPWMRVMMEVIAMADPAREISPVRWGAAGKDWDGGYAPSAGVVLKGVGKV